MADILKEILKDIPSGKISDAGFEGANIVLYTTDKDFFIDNKVPVHERYSVPILTCSSGIIWICGYYTFPIKLPAICPAQLGFFDFDKNRLPVASGIVN